MLSSVTTHSDTAHTAASFTGIHAFLTDHAARRLRAREAPRTTCSIHFQASTTRTIKPPLHGIDAMLPAVHGATESAWQSDTGPRGHRVCEMWALFRPNPLRLLTRHRSCSSCRKGFYTYCPPASHTSDSYRVSATASLSPHMQREVQRTRCRLYACSPYERSTCRPQACRG